MYQFTVVMALVDFVPVLFFGIAAGLLIADLGGRMGKTAFALFAAGTIDVFAAGFLKALWKLLYAAGLCDFHALNTLFLPLQSLGFLMAGVGIVLMLTGKKNAMLALAAPPLYKGVALFISMMVLGLGAICTCLSILAARMKKRGAIVLFLLSFLCSMGMGAISGKDSTQAFINWLEQAINCAGQGFLLAGVVVLHKAGLKTDRNS